MKWPFTGLTTPKSAKGKPYPQLVPDPKVNISVYGKPTTPVMELNGYDLNTVYYAAKSEIRVTANPLKSFVPDYSVMVLRKSDNPAIDYEIEIYRPDSQDYAEWVAACNQTMPSGGSAVPRKFGWF